MSASEKLGALDERMPPEPWMASNTKVRDMKALRKALPQIVAVVEAAEAARPPMGPSIYDPLRAALAALDEALDPRP